MSRVWIVLGETVAADTARGSRFRDRAERPRRPSPSSRRRTGRVGPGPCAGLAQARPRRPRRDRRIGSRSLPGDRKFGSMWGRRPRVLGDPDPGETRVLAAAADQLGGSLERDRLTRDATSAEVSRRSEALKSALLDSVSHDLRTPLASIRAAAGTLMDPDIEWPPDQRREIAASIDREAEWLNRLVTNLLDMSRVEAGELRPSLVVLPVSDVVAEAVRRAAGALGERPVDVQVDPDLPPDPRRRGVHRPGPQQRSRQCRQVRRARGADPDLRLRAGRRAGPDHGRGRWVRASPDDACRGCSRSSTACLAKGEGSRRGTGIGLAVVRGLVEAMGGRVDRAAQRARRSRGRHRPAERGAPSRRPPSPTRSADGLDDRRRTSVASDPARRGRCRDPTRDRDLPRAATLTMSSRPATPRSALDAWAARRPDLHRARPRAAGPGRPDRHPARSVARPRRRSSSCRPATASRTRSRPSTSAPTTT